MSIRSNFKQALNEISGSGQKPEEMTEVKNEDNYQKKEATPYTADKTTVSPASQSAAYSASADRKTENPQGNIYNTEKNVPVVSANDTAASQIKDSAVITADTQIHGAIVTKSPLIIKGKVKGNILCEETVSLTGEIEGNITAIAIEIKGASVKGDLRMKKSAIIEDGAVIQGNLEAESAIVNCVLEGDMRVKGNINIMQNSKIRGDIYAGSLEIEKGAVISGKVAIAVEDEPVKPATDSKTTPTPAKPTSVQPAAKPVVHNTAAVKPANPLQSSAARPATAQQATSSDSKPVQPQQ